MKTAFLLLFFTTVLFEVSLSQNYENERSVLFLERDNRLTFDSYSNNSSSKLAHFNSTEYNWFFEGQQLQFDLNYLPRRDRNPKVAKALKIVGGSAILGYMITGGVILIRQTNQDPSSGKYAEGVDRFTKSAGALSILGGLGASIPLYYRAKNPRREWLRIE